MPSAAGRILATVKAAEVTEAVRPITEEILRTLAACLDDLPPQALTDVLAEGVVVFGGSSQIQGFPRSWRRASASRSSSRRLPMTCVADGAARALRNRPLLAAYARR